MPPRLRGLALPTPDPSRAAAFWRDCFGFAPVRTRGAGHLELDAGGMPLYLDAADGPDTAPVPAPVIEVDDLDAALRRCAEHVAAAPPIRTVGDGGRYAALADPDGNPFWLYEPGTRTAP